MLKQTVEATHKEQRWGPRIIRGYGRRNTFIPQWVTKPEEDVKQSEFLKKTSSEGVKQSESLKKTSSTEEVKQSEFLKKTSSEEVKQSESLKKTSSTEEVKQSEFLKKTSSEEVKQSELLKKKTLEESTSEGCGGKVGVVEVRSDRQGSQAIEVVNAVNAVNAVGVDGVEKLNEKEKEMSEIMEIDLTNTQEIVVSVTTCPKQQKAASAEVIEIDLTNTQDTQEDAATVPNPQPQKALSVPPSKPQTSTRREFLSRFCPRMKFQQLQQKKMKCTGSSVDKQYVPPSSPQISLSKFKSLKIQHDKLHSELNTCKSTIEDLRERVTLIDYGISFQKKASGGKSTPSLRNSVSDIVLDTLQAPVVTFKVPLRPAGVKRLNPKSQSQHSQSQPPVKRCKCGHSSHSSCKNCTKDFRQSSQSIQFTQSTQSTQSQFNLPDQPLQRSLPPLRPLSDDMWKSIQKRHRTEFVTLFNATDKSANKNTVSSSSGFSSSSCPPSSKDSGFSSVHSNSKSILHTQPSPFAVPALSQSMKLAMTIASHSQRDAISLSRKKFDLLNSKFVVSQNVK